MEEKDPLPHISVASSKERERPPRFLSAHFEHDFTAHGVSPVFLLTLVLSSLPESALVLRARALKPIRSPVIPDTSTLGSHCWEPLPSLESNPSIKRNNPRRVTSDAFAIEQMSDWVLGDPDSFAAL